MAPEGHRPRPAGLDPLAPVGRRRRRLRPHPARLRRKVNRKVRAQAFRSALRAHADRGSAGPDGPDRLGRAVHQAGRRPTCARRPKRWTVRPLLRGRGRPRRRRARSFRNLAGVHVLAADRARDRGPDGRRAPCSWSAPPGSASPASRPRSRRSTPRPSRSRRAEADEEGPEPAPISRSPRAEEPAVEEPVAEEPAAVEAEEPAAEEPTAEAAAEPRSPPPRPRSPRPSRRGPRHAPPAPLARQARRREPEAAEPEAEPSRRAGPRGRGRRAPDGEKED